jgi:uncharacterized protein
MKYFLKTELNVLGAFFKSYSSEIIVAASAALFFSLAYYHPIGREWVSSFLFYAVFPLLVIVLVLRKNPLDFGLRLGDWRAWGFYTIVFCIVAGIILYFSSFSQSLRAYYLDDKFNFVTYFFTNVVSLAAWEFIYRGFLLFGLKDKFKEGSIIIQMIPFVLMHLGKPELETVSTIITGILFGYICYRGKSYWPAFIMYLFINVFFVSLINFRY